MPEYGQPPPVPPEDSASRDREIREAVRDAALRLLAHRPRSRRELVRRLRRKDLPGPAIEACLDRLESQGLVDDPAFARAWIRDRLRLKPRGRRALLAELRKHGIAAATAEAAVTEVFEEEDVSDRRLAVRVAEGWLRRQSRAIRGAFSAPPFSPDRQRARRRLAGYLGRRGFGGGDLAAGMEAVEAEVRE